MDIENICIRENVYTKQIYVKQKNIYQDKGCKKLKIHK